MMKKYFTLLLGLILSVYHAAAQPVEMATTLRSEGKIFVVVGVMLIIFLGVAAYLFSIDARVKKLENKK